MIDEGNQGTAAKDSLVKSESVRNLSSFTSQVVQKSEGEQSCMEMEGRGISGFYRNTSEDMFLKALMENPVGMPTPTMDMMGFRNLSHNFRADSEELFKSWLTNAESHGYNSPSMAHRSRQISRRLSTEMANLSNQLNGDITQSRISNESSFTQNGLKVNDIPPVVSHDSTRNAVESGWLASNLYLAKAWFHSSQPMTRSRSSELRRRYAATHNAPTTIGLEAMQNATGEGVRIQQEFANPSGFTENSLNEIPDQLCPPFISPSNSCSSTFNAHPVKNLDRVSSVVSMLKGTLERKKMGILSEKEASEEYSPGVFQEQGPSSNGYFSQGGRGALIHETPSLFDEVFPSHVKDADGIIDLDFEGFTDAANPTQRGTLSQEPSQSESSAAAPVVSPNFDPFDEPGTSTQAPGICQSSRNHVSISAENGSKYKGTDFRDRIIGNLKNEKKRGSLVRYGSTASTDSGDKGDPTKKRRVERSRKMAEAKERNSTATIPSDMQSILKRCDNLEKEVRSLKLNLSFMNRKDSEQTKQIEDLQKQNSELGEEKERLLEEIERILGNSGE